MTLLGDRKASEAALGDSLRKASFSDRLCDLLPRTCADDGSLAMPLDLSLCGDETDNREHGGYC